MSAPNGQGLVADSSVAVTAVETLDVLASHADAWDALAERAARRGLMAATYPWLASYVEHRLEGASWTCLFAWVDGTLAGVLPLVRRPHAVLRGRRPWLWVPNDVHTTGGAGLVDPAHAATVFPALIDHALRSQPRPIGLRLGGMLPDDPSLSWLEAHPAAVVAREEQGGRVLPLAGDWEACRAALGSNLRRNLRKARNRLGRLGHVEIQQFEDPSPLQRYLDLEATGWKGEDGGAVLCSAPLTRFYRSFCERLAAHGRLEWSFLDLDGRTLAGALAFRYGPQIVLMRVAHDEEHARLSPGQVLLEGMLERWFQAGRLEQVDCLTDQPWHKTWRMVYAPYASARIPAPGLTSRLAGDLPARLRTRLKRIPALRRWVRRMRGEGDA